MACASKELSCTRFYFSIGNLMGKIELVVKAKHEFECRNIWKSLELLGSFELSRLNCKGQLQTFFHVHLRLPR